MTVALCMFALWAWGGWISWKGIENGNGWIGVILSEKIRKSLNKKENWWKKALSQAQLAEMVGVSRNTISSIETGQFNPTAKLALVLCIALDKKFEELFYF